MFAVDLGRQRLEACVLTFHVDSLKSFNDVNPEDPDKTPLGLALSSITLVMLAGQHGTPKGTRRPREPHNKRK